MEHSNSTRIAAETVTKLEQSVHECGETQLQDWQDLQGRGQLVLGKEDGAQDGRRKTAGQDT